MNRECLGDDVYICLEYKKVVITKKVGQFETDKIELDNKMLYKLIDYAIRCEQEQNER